jgi:hypothetical protein
MASRDTAIFPSGRTSHFGVLISDDEETDSRVLPVIDESVTSKDSANKTPSAPLPVPVTHNDNDNDTSDDWSQAKAKPHGRKGFQQTGSRSSAGFSRHGGNSFGTSPQNHQQQHFQQGGHHHNPHGHHGHHNVNGPRKQFIPPVTLEQLNPEQTLEIFDFPESWRTSDIRKLLSPFDGQYRLKWQNDTSCFIHFDSAEAAGKALDEITSEEAALRRFSPENIVATVPKADLPQLHTGNTLEIYSFPSTWHSAELNNLLSAWTGQYRLKWRNDAACYVVFDSEEVLKKAQEALCKVETCKVRPYIPPHQLGGASPLISTKTS